MSRFHDEFFRKTETRHDELIMKCVREEGRKRIIEKSNIIDDIIKWQEEIIRMVIVTYSELPKETID